MSRTQIHEPPDLSREVDLPREIGLPRVVAPLCAVMAAIAIIVFSLLMLTTRRADDVSTRRQEQLAALVFGQALKRVPHDQESVTVWDEAVAKVRSRPLDLAWLDANLGVWMHTYFGQDRVYILDDRNRPIYASLASKRSTPEAYAAVAGPAGQLAAELRRSMATGAAERLDPDVLSPGAADFVVLDGHPAILSVKPILSDSGRTGQAPGSEYLHVAVRELDGSLLGELSDNYQFDGARFAMTDDRQDGERAHPLVSRTGQTLGYFIWRPFLPARAVLLQTMPALLVALAAVALVIGLLVGRLRKGAVELRASQSRANYLALHDTLTGLPNRALFNDRLERSVAAARRPQAMTALLYLDLDRFKQVNDTFGHPAGDELIRQVAHRLTTLVRESDTVARLGGDEFAMIVGPVRGAREVEQIAGAAVAQLCQPFHIAGAEVGVGVSIGIALAPADARDSVELTRKADLALYRAKAEGRGRFVFFTDQLDPRPSPPQRHPEGALAAFAAGPPLGAARLA